MEAKKPCGANRCHEILCSMSKHAIAWGRRPEALGNPCKRIVRHRRLPRARLLGADNPTKLGAILCQRKVENKKQNEWFIMGNEMLLSRGYPKPMRGSFPSYIGNAQLEFQKISEEFLAIIGLQ